MKYLVLLLVVAVVFWLIRSSRRPPSEPRPKAPPAAAAPPGIEDIVRCSSCGVHLPRSEALAGRGGLFYCGEGHRAEHERAQGGR